MHTQLLLIVALICAPSLMKARDVWESMVRVFGEKERNSTWENALQEIEEYLKKVPNEMTIPNPITEDTEKEADDKDNFKDGNQRIEDQDMDYLPSEETAESIRSQSPFAKFFQKPRSVSCEPNFPIITNHYYKPKVLDFIFKVWLPLYALWGQFALAEIFGLSKYLTNAKIESWFA